eukprot:CAMPEP_0172663834 /NCGR_PEP_ID=MMETSP1074-20121228/6189_1 /TAXON_ID=2916 /ORGANISM="Ceratium fusus, Strain PA161109" /LENGTH=584 /DNA_ID=CAMNT_0013479891 /DNA_START=157 /DNA_END=1911 /DNA_ORIENTATION=+
MITEEHPPLKLLTCTKGGDCTGELRHVTLDANWRFVHGGKKRRRCFQKGHWNKFLCPDPAKCARTCLIEGVDRGGYESLYGVTPTPHGGIRMRHMARGTNTPHGSMRLYVMEDATSYKVFKLKNREFAFEVDSSRLPCGLRGSVYFVGMRPDGHQVGGNSAGARLGTGYCDAHCPRDLQFVGGEANMLDWDLDANMGRYGHCCSELRLWRANAQEADLSMHPCSVHSAARCEGGACANATSWGLCEGEGGCKLPAEGRSGDDLFGDGGLVDTTRPFTVVTRFLTEDGSDNGHLSAIQRLFVQDGRVIGGQGADQLSASPVVTEAYCKDQVAAATGQSGRARSWNGRRLQTLGEALDRGMVMVLALEDESGLPKRGAIGPCPVDSGDPAARAAYPESTVSYWGFRHGPLGSTVDADSSRAAPRETFSGELGKESSGAKLPAGWQPRSSPFNRSLLYFYDTISGQTSWTVPPTQAAHTIPSPQSGLAAVLQADAGSSHDIALRDTSHNHLWLLRNNAEGILFDPACRLMVGAILVFSVPTAFASFILFCRRGTSLSQRAASRPPWHVRLVAATEQPADNARLELIA